jgi:hypothetical protein
MRIGLINIKRGHLPFDSLQGQIVRARLFHY